MKEEFSKYEIARILGARALQISMDAPLLLKISDEELEEMKYDALKISEKEFFSDVLPISVKRPFPQKKKEKLEPIKEEVVDDKKIIEKEIQEEKEIAEDVEELGFENPDADETIEEESNNSE